MLAPAVVDAVEQVDVALYAPQLLFRLARRVNKLGLVGAEAVNEPLPVVLAVVQLHEMGRMYEFQLNVNNPDI